MMEIILLITPIWSAFIVGLVTGWIWRPKWWEILGINRFESLMSKIVEYSAPPTSKMFPSIQSFTPSTLNFSSCKKDVIGEDVHAFSSNVEKLSLKPTFADSNCSSSQQKGEEHPVVDDGDLVHLYKLVEEKDGGPSWIQMMDRSTPTMNYRAWRRDPETGSPQ